MLPKPLPRKVLLTKSSFTGCCRRWNDSNYWCYLLSSANRISCYKTDFDKSSSFVLRHTLLASCYSLRIYSVTFWSKRIEIRKWDVSVHHRSAARECYQRTDSSYLKDVCMRNLLLATFISDLMSIFLSATNFVLSLLFQSSECLAFLL
jgi:hypothetical protein